MSNLRVDILLVEQKRVRSRTEAQKLIAQGRVSLLSAGVAKKITKASEKFPFSAEFLVEPGEEQKYVPRAGLKLEFAITQAEIPVVNASALDIGQSTGGFTDCLLRFGAGEVVGIEVGHGQLAEGLRSNSRVTCIEGYNARELSLQSLPANNAQGFDVVVMDVSFISQRLILPAIAGVVKPGAWLVSLVKPQFEVGKQGIGKGGLVKDRGLYPIVERELCALIQQLGWRLVAYLSSPLPGGDGNREFLMIAQRG